MRSKRCICILLCVCTLVTMLPSSATAAKDVTDSFCEQVQDNFDALLNTTDCYPYLIGEADYSQYYYKMWAEKVRNGNFAQIAATYAANILLDSNLDEDAYVKYLSNLMVMVEHGCAETAERQASYVQKKYLGDDVVDTVVSTILLDKDIKEELGDAFKLLSGGTSFLSKVVTDAQEYKALSAVAAIHETQIRILRAIKENTSSKDLQNAAQTVMDNFNYQFVFLTENYLGDIVGIMNDAADSADVYDQILQKTANLTKKEFGKWIQKKAEKKLGKAFVQNALIFAEGFSCFMAGVKIGSLLMKAVHGTQAELFREMNAMDVISDALTKALKKARIDAATGSGSERYEDICQFVAVAKGLIHAHNRGEYCDSASRKETSKYHEQHYDNIAARMLSYENAVNQVLNADFIIMTDTTDEDIAQYLVRATVPGNDKYGLVDIRTGEMVVEPMFESAGSFGNDGFMKVSMRDDDNSTGLINHEGHFLFAPGQISEVYEFYQGECMLVEQGDKLLLYEGERYTGEIELPDDGAVKTSVGYYWAQGEGSGWITCIPDRFIPIATYDSDDALIAQYWYDNTGKLRYTADSRFGCLVEDETGTYFLTEGYIAKRIDDNGNVTEEIDYYAETSYRWSYYPKVEYEGDRWFAWQFGAVYTNGLNLAWMASNLGYNRFDVDDGIISIDRSYYTLDGTRFYYDKDMAYYRNGYLKVEEGFVDRYAQLVYEFPEGTDVDDYSHVLPGGYFIYRSGSCFGIMNVDGTKVCDAIYSSLYNMEIR